MTTRELGLIISWLISDLVAVFEWVWKLISLCVEVPIREFTNQTQWQMFDAGRQSLPPFLPASAFQLRSIE